MGLLVTWYQVELVYGPLGKLVHGNDDSLVNWFIETLVKGPDCFFETSAGGD